MSLIADNEGKSNELIGSWYEITEQKEAQVALEKLRQERNLLRTLIDSLPNLIYIRDIEGKFLIINKKYARNFELKRPEDAIGKKLTDLISPEMEAHAKESLEEDNGILNSGLPLIDKERVG